MNNDLINKHVLIFINDAVGVFTRSLHLINNIIEINKNSKIKIFFSEKSKNFSFLLATIFKKNKFYGLCIN